MRSLCVWIGRKGRPILTILILIAIGVLVAMGYDLFAVLAGLGAAVLVATEAADRILGGQRDGDVA
jgi:hypothetical protein